MTCKFRPVASCTYMSEHGGPQTVLCLKTEWGLLNAVLWQNLLKAELMQSPNALVLQELKMVAAVILYGFQSMSKYTALEIRRHLQLRKFLT